MKTTRIFAFFVALSACFLPFRSHAQIPDTLWTKTFGGADWDMGSALVQTDSSHYVIAGFSHSYGNGYEIFLFKCDENGDTVWTTIIGGADDDEALDIVRTPSGNLVICGWTSSYGSGLRDAYLLNINGDGDTVWTNTFGGTARDIGFGVHPTIDSGFIIVGETRSSGSGLSDLYLVKVDSQGDSIWARAYGGSGQDLGYSVVSTPDSGFLAVGFTESSGSGMGDVYVLKTDASGDSIWARAFGGALDERGLKIRQANDSGFIITGYSSSTGAGGNDVFVLKLDENGDSVWARCLGGAQHDYGNDIKSCPSGGYLIAGNTRSFGNGNEDLYLLRITENGDTVWTRTYGGTSDDGAQGCIVTPDSGLLITGETYSFGAGGYDLWLLRMQSLSGITHFRDKSASGAKDWEMNAVPNPFKTEVRIQISEAGFDLCHLSSDLCVSIHDIAGRTVKCLSIPHSAFPILNYTWDGRDNAGHSVPAGVYFAVLRSRSHRCSIRLMKIW